MKIVVDKYQGTLFVRICHMKMHILVVDFKFGKGKPLEILDEVKIEVKIDYK